MILQTKIHQDPKTGEYYIQIPVPEKLLKNLDWKVGDYVQYIFDGEKMIPLNKTSIIKPNYDEGIEDPNHMTKITKN